MGQVLNQLVPWYQQYFNKGDSSEELDAISVHLFLSVGTKTGRFRIMQHCEDSTVPFYMLLWAYKKYSHSGMSHHFTQATSPGMFAEDHPFSSPPLLGFHTKQSLCVGWLEDSPLDAIEIAGSTDGSGLSDLVQKILDQMFQEARTAFSYTSILNKKLKAPVPKKKKKIYSSFWYSRERIRLETLQEGFFSFFLLLLT